MARELADLLMDGNELVRMEYIVGLENKKWEKDDLLTYFDAVETALHTQLLTRPGTVLPLLERLKQVRLAVPFHVGTGHLFGWLVAGS